MKENKKNNSVLSFLLQVLQGALIGLGAVLPGISGGVLCVVFGVYKPVMELLSNPLRNLKTHLRILFPIIIGGAIGFLGIANLLGYVLEKYPNPSVCLFIGLIGGMLPSLWREAGKEGRSKNSYISLFIALAVIFAILITLNITSAIIVPNFAWYVFCGFCLALSVIAPGMSFSTLLMPLGLYTPFVSGIASIDFSVLIPAGIGGLATVICFAKLVNFLFNKYYSVAFHAIVGIVIAATLMIVPYTSFLESASSCIINIVCLVFGVVSALILDKFNSSISVN